MPPLLPGGGALGSCEPHPSQRARIQLWESPAPFWLEKKLSYSFGERKEEKKPNTSPVFLFQTQT